MIRSRGFASVTAADFIVRSAYQMGKTPLLPLFAAALGAGDAFLGFIASVSTLTGMVLKPFIGILSDRWGRRCWLIAGTAVFATMPFVYRFVHSPEQLFAVRMMHGLATAIYGPVTLAYVAEQSRSRPAERLAWFGTARNAGYVVGPMAAGWMLLSMDPVSVFTVVVIFSSVALVPILFLPERELTFRRRPRRLIEHALSALASGGRTSAIWLAGGLEAATYVALYAAKTFLPIYALSAGFNVAVVGTFFAVQEAAHMVLNPLGGRIGDRLGHLHAVPLGMALLGAVLPLLLIADTVPLLIALATLVGAAQALVFPSTVALVSAHVNEKNVGASMGLLGTMRNAGKVAGPVLAGVLVHLLDYSVAFRLIGLALLLARIPHLAKTSDAVNRQLSCFSSRYMNLLARIHRRTSLGTALEEASGCSSESGIMVLEQKPARKEGAPNRCCHRTNPTVSASSLTTIAWWPMPACSCRPP